MGVLIAVKCHPPAATRFYANDPLPHVNNVDWVIVLGGPMNTHEDAKYPWLITEKRFIERAIKQHKTVIGVAPQFQDSS